MRARQVMTLAAALATAGCGGDIPDVAASHVPVDTAASTAPIDTLAAGPLEVEGDGYQGVILADALPTRFPEQWTPTPEDIAELEEALPAYFETVIASAATHPGPSGAAQAEYEAIAEQLPTYLRQYTGVRGATEDMIYVNAFCPDPAFPDWRTEVVLVAGGGTCFWTVMWHTTTGTFSELLVNGPH